MKNEELYLKNLIKHASKLDNLVKKEIKQSYYQSIDDLGLTEESYDNIVASLGSPDTFISEYLREREDGNNQVKSKIKIISKLKASYVLVLILHFQAILLLDFESSNYAPSRLANEAKINANYFFLISIAIVIGSYNYGSWLIARGKNFKQLYLITVIHVSLFYLANVIIDDFVFGFDNLIEVFFGGSIIPLLGILLLFLIPTSIMTGLAVRMFKLSNDPNYEDESGPAREVSIFSFVWKLSLYLTYLVVWGATKYLLTAIGITVTTVLRIIDAKYFNISGEKIKDLNGKIIYSIIKIILLFIIIAFYRSRTVWGFSPY